MKYKKGDITFFTKTYSEKHKSCHICKIIKEYPTENKYLVMNMIITHQILIIK